MKYRLSFTNGMNDRQAGSMREALIIARRALGVGRVYRGAEYQTDEPAEDGDRRYVTGLDIWASRYNANREMSTTADCVITW